MNSRGLFEISELASYVCWYCQNCKQLELNTTKLHKLCYCCYGIVLARFHIRLTKQHVQAWYSGPYFHHLYHDVKDNRLSMSAAMKFKNNCNESVLQYVNNTLDTFDCYSSDALCDWLQNKDFAWYKTCPLCSIDDIDIMNDFKFYIEVVEKVEQNTKEHVQ